MAALNVRPAHIYPRAMQEIDKMIEIVQGLIGKGFAYVVGGNVYFRVRNFADYGKLSNRSLESMMAGARVEAEEEKEHPMDFILWKESKPGEPSWQSPWGMGRPGWHIECSAMSLKYLGETLDIHGGGQDLVFPHHENEIAQSESYTGVKPFAKYWMHNGMVQLGEEKMSKSLGNLITIREALEKYSADAIRIFILSSYYRSPLTYSEEVLGAAERGAERLRQVARRELTGKSIEKQIDIEMYKQKFIEAMDDDFNTAQVMATLFDLARDVNRYDDEGYDALHGQQILIALSSILGLTLKEREKQISGQVDLDEIDSRDIAKTRGEKLDWFLETIENTVKDPNIDIETIRGYVNLALGVRDSLRKDRQYQRADEIRTRLMSCGFIIEDTPASSRWIYKPVNNRK
jgi:cysteinyl-tRNA synthetase